MIQSNRETIYIALSSKGFPPEWVSWIKKLSESILTQVMQGKKLSGTIPFLSGVPQGGPLSPILFNLAIELLITELNESALKLSSIAPTASVWYADDGVLVLLFLLTLTGE